MSRVILRESHAERARRNVAGGDMREATALAGELGELQ